MSRRVIPGGLISVGFQRISGPSNTFLNSTCQAGSAFLISVETQSVRMTVDGATTPTANTGVLLTAANSPYYYEGLDGTKPKFAQAAATAVMNVQAWRRV